MIPPVCEGYLYAVHGYKPYSRGIYVLVGTGTVAIRNAKPRVMHETEPQPNQYSMYYCTSSILYPVQLLLPYKYRYPAYRREEQMMKKIAEYEYSTVRI